MRNEPEGYMNQELFFSNAVHFFIDHYQLKAHNSYAIIVLRRDRPSSDIIVAVDRHHGMLTKDYVRS